MKRSIIITLVGLIATSSVAFVVVSAPWLVDTAFVTSESMSEAIPQNSSVEVRYIANEGVLISSKDKSVLIDGLHRQYGPDYAYLPDTEREKIETAQPPFEGIDLLLVSHMHGDHFHPESVGRYLVSSPSTVLASSQQVVDLVESKFVGYDKIKSRVTPITYKLKERKTINLGGIDVEFLGVGHGTGRHASIENLGHVFKLGGKTFLHIGDAEFTPEVFEALDLENRGIDIAFLPSWYLTATAGRSIIRDHIKPKHIIAVHVAPGAADKLRQQIAAEFPKADVFGTMLEKRFF